MPLSPQIVITPEDIVYKSFSISAVIYTSSTATYTAVGHTLSAGNIVMITGLTPDGYNGTYTILSITTDTFTISNTTNAVLTDEIGNVYWADPTDYEYEGGQTVNYIADAQDIDSVTILANGKNKAYRQATPPPSGSSADATINEGDLWFDTDDKNKEYYYTSGAWVSVQDGTIADAQADADAALAAATAAAAEASAAAATASAASAAAALAAADADAAQAAAATAYATAVAANTAAGVAQTTANGKNKVTYATAAPGSTANTVGDIWYQYGTTSPNVGRIIAQYSGAGGTSWTQTTISGLVIANIDAGNITTGTLTAAVGISNPSGNFSVNGATGALVATGATITGAVNALSGYFGTASNGFSISSTGLVGVGSGTIVGGVISGATFINGGGTFSVSSAGYLTASSGQIGGSTFTSTSITGGIVQTSLGATAVILNGANNSLTFKTNSSNVGHILPLNVGGSAFGILTHYGATADPSGGTFPQSYVGATNVLIAANNSNYVSVNSGGFGVQIVGNTTINNTLTYPGIATGSGSPMVVVTTGSRVAYSTSSERFKQDIAYITTPGWLDKVMAMKPITYKTSEDFTTEGEPNETQIGFLAEDIYDLGGGLETAVILDPLGDPFSLSYDRLTVFLMLAIKELKQELDQLKGN